MNATTQSNLRYIIVAVTILLLAIGFAIDSTPKAGAAAPSGLPATVATSSSQIVITSAPIIFATSTCAARIITVNAGGNIMLTFSDMLGQTPTATFGRFQAASTTVEYDSGIYGCGSVKAYGSGVTITTTETR